MSNWLFLRGEWDERTQKSIDDNDDMWLQLFNELSDNGGPVWLKGEGSLKLLNRNINQNDKHNRKIDIYSCPVDRVLDFTAPDIIFARGGFDCYLPILKACPDAYKIRYGAGKRFMPEPEIDYQLILVDTEKQKQAVLKQYPKANVHLFIKPAALHFKPIECEKEYDFIYVANEQQAGFKGTKFVYNTIPRHLKLLHLGYIDQHINPPDNITRKRVDRKDMAKEYSRGRVLVVPYENIDSAPRVIPEAIACGLPIVCLDSVNIWYEKYKYITRSNKKQFWAKAEVVKDCEIFSPSTEGIAQDYQDNLSLPVAVKHLKEVING